jgi:hypothetical protein
MISSTRITGIFLAILLGLPAIAMLVGAAEAKQEKFPVCHNQTDEETGETGTKTLYVGSEKAVDAHVRNHGDTDGVCGDVTLPPPPTNPLVGLVPVVADPNVDGSINNLTFPTLAGCTIEPTASVTLEVTTAGRQGEQFVLTNGLDTTTITQFPEGLSIEATGNLTFVGENGTGVTLSSGTQFKVVSSKGITGCTVR